MLRLAEPGRKVNGLAAGAGIALLLAAAACGREEVPSTDIFLVEARIDPGAIVLGRVRNVTQREGYDNQPSFAANSDAFLYTSIGEEGQADVYRYDIADGRATRVTHSPEHEYSPTLTPAGDGISVVRVEADGTQRLWLIEPGSGEARLLAPETRGVGYHLWIDAQTVAFYILAASEEEGATLEIVDLESGTRRVAARAIGRTLAPMPEGGSISFVDMTDEKQWWVSALDPASGEIRRLVATIPGCEDYAWAPNGNLLMPCGSALYRWVPSTPSWDLVENLSRQGLTGLTRVAVSPDGRWVALVGADR